jgi:peptide deformylase
VASKYKVITYGNPLLRKKATPVKVVDASISKLAREMLEVLYSAKGVGLAAQQIGRTEAICVIDVPAQHDKEKDGASLPMATPDIGMPIVMINPRIEAASGEQRCDEGCLSFPEIYVSIKRAEEVTVSFNNLDNKKVTVLAAGLFARAVQHELDHLNGILLVDRMSPLQKIAIAGKLKRLKKQSQEDE